MTSQNLLSTQEETLSECLLCKTIGIRSKENLSPGCGKNPNVEERRNNEPLADENIKVRRLVVKQTNKKNRKASKLEDGNTTTKWHFWTEFDLFDRGI